MRIWILRHAHALAAEGRGDEADARRPLSRKGRDATRALGRWFRANGLLREAKACWHSPLVRAIETAGVFRSAARLRAPLREVPGLEHGDDPALMARRLEKHSGPPVILVGHEPHLSALATTLVAGRAQPVQFELRKGALLALERTSARHRNGRRRWIVRWQVAPELLG